MSFKRQQGQLPPLPPYWEERVDERTGYPYFLNHQTKTTQWQDPRLEGAGADPNDGRFRDSVEIPVNLHNENRPSHQHQTYPYQSPEMPQPNHHYQHHPGPRMTQQLPQHQEQQFFNPGMPYNQASGLSTQRFPTNQQPQESTTPTSHLSPSMMHRGQHSNEKRHRSRSPAAPTMTEYTTEPSGYSETDGGGPIDEGSYCEESLTAPPVPPQIEAIYAIKTDSEQWHAKISQFTGKKSDNDYKYIEEMLERNLCKLDNVDANGIEEIRNQRKDCVRYIQQCLDQLELKAMANEVDM